jgi:hypothetical protein
MRPEKIAKELIGLVREILSAKEEWVKDGGKQYRFNPETGRFHDRTGEPVNNQGLHSRLMEKRQPTKYDKNFLKRLIDLEPESGVFAVGEHRKKKTTSI